MFPFVFPPGYPFSPGVLSQSSSSTHTASGHPSSITAHSHSPLSQKRSTTHRYIHKRYYCHFILYFDISKRSMDNSPQQHHKLSMSHEDIKQKKPHIKKPLNAFMLFMKEQRAQVVQECTLRESAAINQILGRKVCLFFSKQNKTDLCFSGMNSIVMSNKNIMIWHVMNV
jgi:hypothetical protein